MARWKVLSSTALTALLVVVATGDVQARQNRRVYRHHAYHQRYDRAGNRDAAGFVAGSALGLLGAGIAGATAADNGYGSSYPAYGSGYSGFGYYGPGYGYYGY